MVDETGEVFGVEVVPCGVLWVATLRVDRDRGAGRTPRSAATHASHRYGVAEILAPGVASRGEMLARLRRERAAEIEHQRVQREVAVARETVRCIAVCQSLVERLGAVLTMGQRAAVMLAAWEMRPKGRRSDG